MTRGMGNENDAAKGTLVTDVSLSVGLAQIYDLQRKVSSSKRVFSRVR
jgi:hypothetical protein